MCPNCGYCPHCGRGGWTAQPIWQWVPQTAPYYTMGNPAGANALPFNGTVRMTTTGAAEQPKLSITMWNS